MKKILYAALTVLLFTTPASALEDCAKSGLLPKQAWLPGVESTAVKVYRFNGDTVRQIADNYDKKNHVAPQSDNHKNVSEGIVMFFHDGTGTVALFDAQGNTCETGVLRGKDFFNAWMLPFIGEDA